MIFRHAHTKANMDTVTGEADNSEHLCEIRENKDVNRRIKGTPMEMKVDSSGMEPDP